MSAPPVPTSSTVSESRCAASASIASALSRTPPSQRLIRRRSRRLPASVGRIVQRPVEKLDGIGEAVHRASVRRAGTMGRMIVVAGEALIDILVQPDGRLTAVPGGGPFNTARTIGRLGGQVAFLGRLSNDRFGGVLRDGLTESDVDLSLVEPTDAPTTLAIAELDDDGAATYRFHTTDTSAAALSPDAVEAALARRPRAVHLGTLGLALEPVADVLAAAIPAVGVETLVMLDPNCRPRGHPRPRCVSRPARADPDPRRCRQGQHRRPRVPRPGSLADGCRAGVPRSRRDRRPRDRRARAGPHRDRDGRRPARRSRLVSIVDTVGAGDAFGGGFLARWIERGSGREDLADSAGVRDAVAFGIAVAVRTCQRAGADPPRRADLPRAVGLTGPDRIPAMPRAIRRLVPAAFAILLLAATAPGAAAVDRRASRPRASATAASMCRPSRAFSSHTTSRRPSMAPSPRRRSRRSRRSRPRTA